MSSGKKPNVVWHVEMHGGQPYGFAFWPYDEDVDRYVEINYALNDGTPLPEGAEIPKEFWVQREFAEDDRAKLPRIFPAKGPVIMRECAAEVFRQFDLGESQLIPVDLYKSDRTTRFDDQFYLLYLTQRKNAFLPEESKNYDERGYKDNPRYRGRVLAQRGTVQDDICLAPEALEGPDMWREPSLARSIFVTDRLMKAIRKARLLYRIPVVRCRIREEGAS